MIEPRWLDRDAAAKYLSVEKAELPKLVKAGKLPEPSLHFGPKSPRWDRLELDRVMGGDSGPDREIEEIRARIAAYGAGTPTRRKARDRLPPGSSAT